MAEVVPLWNDVIELAELIGVPVLGASLDERNDGRDGAIHYPRQSFLY